MPAGRLPPLPPPPWPRPLRPAARCGHAARCRAGTSLVGEEDRGDGRPGPRPHVRRRDRRGRRDAVGQHGRDRSHGRPRPGTHLPVPRRSGQQGQRGAAGAQPAASGPAGSGPAGAPRPAGPAGRQPAARPARPVRLRLRLRSPADSGGLIGPGPQQLLQLSPDELLQLLDEQGQLGSGGSGADRPLTAARPEPGRPEPGRHRRPGRRDPHHLRRQGWRCDDSRRGRCHDRTMTAPSRRPAVVVGFARPSPHVLAAVATGRASWPRKHPAYGIGM